MARAAIALTGLLLAFTAPHLPAAETVRIGQRVAAYAGPSTTKLEGYFPPGADLAILEVREGAWAHTRFVSASGTEVTAWTRLSDLGLSAEAAQDLVAPAKGPEPGSIVVIAHPVRAYLESKPTHWADLPAGARVIARETSPDQTVICEVNTKDGSIRVMVRLGDIEGFEAAAPPEASSAQRLQRWGTRPRQAPFDWTPVAAERMDSRLMGETERRTLALDAFTWQQAHTEHFVLHHDNEVFAKRIAQMAEYYYDYIASDLRGPRDHMPGRSHIFIFRRAGSWDAFTQAVPTGAGEWAFSFVRGPAMYLQRSGDPRDNANVLAHEMSHLILNRFFARPIPLWLNEGLAEWYGEFAYSAFNGVTPGVRSRFTQMKASMPMREQLALTSYPPTKRQVSVFYEQSKYLVGYLRIVHGEEPFLRFIGAIMDGSDPQKALLDCTGFTSLEEVERGFRSFARL